MKKLFELIVIQKNDINLDGTCEGDILLSPSGEGYFTGDMLNGHLVPVGMGTAHTRFPGKNDIEAGMLLCTEDGIHILMDVKAYFDIEENLERKMAGGELVSPDQYYYKGTVGFRTGDPRYQWLERKICVCIVVVESWERLRFQVYMV